MDWTRRLTRALASLSLAALPAACGGATGAAGTPASAASAAPALSIVERSETGPITAIAARGSILYAGSSRGLRRWDTSSDEYETLGADVGLPSHGITALGFDGEGQIWVASDAGVGRLARGKGDSKETYQSFGGLAGITVLAPTADGRGAWAGGADGLFRSDGKSWTPIPELQGVAVTSLDLDRDGTSAWVGTRALGLLHADGDHARGVLIGDDPAGLEIVGTAVTTIGTRVVGARDMRGEGARLVFLEQGEPQAFKAQPEARMVRIVDSGKDAVLVAGPAGAERAYSLQLLRAGEPPPPGGLRFVSVKKGTPSARGKDRWAAVPLDEVPPPGVTVAAGSDGAVYYGTERRGVARGAKHAPAFFSGAELVGDADRLTVACAAKDRCFAVTDGPRAWVTDGDTYRSTRVGEADDGAALAVAADRAGTVYALSTDPKFTGLVVTRLAEAVVVGAAQAAVGDTWKSYERVPLKMPVEGPPGVSFAGLSPAGTLWVGVRAHVKSAGGEDQDVSAGAVELRKSGSAPRDPHHALKEGEGERRHAGRCPPRSRAWWCLRRLRRGQFSSLSGIDAWQQGDLRTWGRREEKPRASSCTAWARRRATSSGRRRRRASRASTGRSGARTATPRRRWSPATASRATRPTTCGSRPPRACDV